MGSIDHSDEEHSRVGSLDDLAKEKAAKKEKKRLKKEKKKRKRCEKGVVDTEEAVVVDENDSTPTNKDLRKEKKKRKKHEKKKRKEKKARRSEHKKHSHEVSDGVQTESLSSNDDEHPHDRIKKGPTVKDETNVVNGRPLVESSSLSSEETPDYDHQTTILLFYQYIKPVWSDSVYKKVLKQIQEIGTTCQVNGRMRVAKEGLNCTLSGSADHIREFCYALRHWKPDAFLQTEFKLTHHCTESHAFSQLKVMPVSELVHYGLDGAKAEIIQDYSGTHLEPKQYHAKLADKDTVVIDVRNHYEAEIGRFDPPTSTFLDPRMRKSTEFPVWLDDPATQQQLKGKQVLMYCTGGIRCERASALLKYKMETDESTQNLGIKGVYQLQGGIDKYFRAFPDGGHWKGKNYTFDKRCAHVPVEKAANAAATTSTSTTTNTSKLAPLSKCHACQKPWDKYGGKRRCPTCGVPSLICKDCHLAHVNGTRILGKMDARCDLCVQQDVRSKRQFRESEEKSLLEYEHRLQSKGLLSSKSKSPSIFSSADTPCGTRLFLKNLCKTTMTDDALLEHIPGITHLVWNMRQGVFLGQCWIEMESLSAAAAAVARSGQKLLERPLYIEYQAAGGKDVWPPRHSSVQEL